MLFILASVYVRISGFFFSEMYLLVSAFSNLLALMSGISGTVFLFFLNNKEYWFLELLYNEV